VAAVTKQNAVIMDIEDEDYDRNGLDPGGGAPDYSYDERTSTRTGSTPAGHCLRASASNGVGVCGATTSCRGVA